MEESRQEPRRCYQMLDTYDMKVLGEYWTQDRAMVDFYNLIRSWGFTTARTVNIIHINDNDEETLMCYGNEPTIKTWVKDLEKLTLALRIKGGTDIIGLNEFIMFSGFNPTTEEKDVPLETLDFERYIVSQDGIQGRGATKLEATTRWYLSFLEAKNDNTEQEI